MSTLREEVEEVEVAVIALFDIAVVRIVHREKIDAIEAVIGFKIDEGQMTNISHLIVPITIAEGIKIEDEGLPLVLGRGLGPLSQRENQ